MKARIFTAVCILLMGGALVLRAQHQHPKESAPPSAEEANTATEAMSMHHHGEGDEGPGHHHEMGPHMKMSALRAAQPGDQQKAEQLVATARAGIEKYKDSKAAEADGFKMFMPQLKHQKQYHFTNWRYAMEAQFRFNAEHPTSLLYDDTSPNKDGSQLRLIGLMYTAPKRYTEDDLDKRVPLSVAQWHEHVNLCVPPADRKQEAFGKDAKFGLQGSIATKEACEAAGGSFRPIIFGWMVHMYPFEKTMDEIWSVERQKPGTLDHQPMQ